VVWGVKQVNWGCGEEEEFKCLKVHTSLLY